MNRIFRYTIFYLLIFLVIIGIFGTFNNANQPTKEIQYHEFVKALENGKITEASIQPDQLVFVVKGKMEGYKKGEEFVTNIPREDQGLMDEIRDEAKKNSNISFLKAPESNGWIQFFTGIIPFVVIFILFFFLLNQAQGGGNRMMSFGKSKAKLYDDQKKKFVLQMLQVPMKRNKNL